MATAITFPVPSVRRHRSLTEAQRAERQAALHRHPSARVVAASAPSVSFVGPRADHEGFVVSCSDCSRQRSSACDDCVVTFLCGASVDLAASEARALALFQSVGLVPPSQHAPASVVA